MKYFLIISTIFSALTAISGFAQTGGHASVGTEVLAVDYVGEEGEGRIQFSFDAGVAVEITTKRNNGEEEKELVQTQLDITPLSVQVSKNITDPSISAFKIEVLKTDISGRAGNSMYVKLAEIKFEKMFDDHFQMSVGQWGGKFKVNDSEKTPITMMIGSSLIELHNSDRDELGGDQWVVWLPLVRGQIKVVHHLTNQLSLQAQATSTVWLTPRGLGDGIESDLLQGITLEASIGLEYQLPKDLVLKAGLTTNANYLYFDSLTSTEGPFTKDLGIIAGVGVEWRPCTKKLKAAGSCR